MIVKEIFYGIECDRCKELHNDGDHEFWFDEDSAVEYAIESDWIEKHGKHYCNDCYEIDNKDNVIIYEDRPEHIKDVINFIRGALKRRVDVIEGDDVFYVKTTIWHKPFKEKDIDYIKSILCDQYCEFTFEKDNYSWTMNIKIKRNDS